MGGNILDEKNHEKNVHEKNLDHKKLVSESDFLSKMIFGQKKSENT